MPITIQQIREKYPQYSDVSDEKLLRGLHTKYYSDMGYSEFVNSVTPDVDPTEGMSGTDRFLAGVGKGLTDTYRGVKQVGSEALSALALSKGGVQRSRQFDATAQDLRAQQDDVAARDAPLMDTGAGLAGAVTGTLASMAIPGAAATKVAPVSGAARAFMNPQTFRAAAGAGAAYGALQPVGTDESRAANTAIGAGTGLASQAVFALGGRVAQPVKNSLTAAGKKAVQVLEDAGVPLDAAQKTGSKALARVKSALFDNPLTQGAERAKIEQQRTAFTRAVLRTIGEDADAATSDVMANAANRIGSVFDDVAARNPVKYDRPLETALGDILKTARNELDDQQYGVIQRQIDNILDKAAANGGAVPGPAYQNIKTSLDRLSMGGDQSKGEWARRVRAELDDALERSASGADLDALRQARTEYRRLKQIEASLAKDGAGEISPARLANTIGMKRNAAQAFRGRGDQTLVELAQAGKQILTDHLPNSGTAARLLSNIYPTAALGAAGGALAGDETSMRNIAIGLAAGALTPKAAQALLRSGYLAGGMSGPARNALMAPSQNALVGTALKQTPLALLPALQE